MKKKRKPVRLTSPPVTAAELIRIYKLTPGRVKELERMLGRRLKP